MISVKKQIGLLAIGITIAGCGMGDAPSGGSSAQVESNFDKQDPQAQIKVIQGSPASPERKAQLIANIEKKYGIKAGAAPVAGGSQSTPAPPQ